ncbi:hypothetical protein AZE42_08210, partial [Rhizopogon vesiculosus]
EDVNLAGALNAEVVAGYTHFNVPSSHPCLAPIDSDNQLKVFLAKSWWVSTV